MLSKPFFAVPCLALLAAPGCLVVDDGQPPPTYYGTLDTQITLAGTNDVSNCAYYGISWTDVALYDEGDNLVADEQPTCEEFGIAFDAPVGNYFVDVTLYDGANNAKSDTVSTQVEVFRDDITVFAIDFPDGSIY